jgi:hypothetical protein
VGTRFFPTLRIEPIDAEPGNEDFHPIKPKNDAKVSFIAIFFRISPSSSPDSRVQRRIILGYFMVQVNNGLKSGLAVAGALRVPFASEWHTEGAYYFVPVC